MADQDQLADLVIAHSNGEANAAELAAAIDEFVQGQITNRAVEGGNALEAVAQEGSDVQPMTSFPCGVTLSLAICSGHRLCRG